MLDQIDIRKQNITRIWEVLSSKTTVTRQELATKTSLSLMSVTNLVDHLNRHHVLSFASPVPENTVRKKAAGRRAEIISLNGEDHAWLLIDLTDRHFRFFALALNKSVLCASPAWGYEENRGYQANVTGFLRRCRKTLENELRRREILGVAVVVPGPYDIDADQVHNKRIPEINAIAIKELLRNELGMYDYYVDEDVKFAVRSYMFLAAQSGSELLYYLYIGEGIGGAAIHAGNVLRGLNAAAGDAGQLLSGPSAVFEETLSLRPFARSIGLNDTQGLSEDELLERIDGVSYADPALYQARLMEAAEQTARMLYSVVWMLDPKQIVVDCRYARTLETEYVSRLNECLKARVNGALTQTASVIPALHDRRSVMYGAAQVLSREWIGRIV